MGLFGKLFGGGGGNAEERFVKRHVGRLMNKYGQKEIREESMYALANRGSQEAITGLLQRLTYNNPESILDEKEKNQVLDLLEAVDEELVKEPLRTYIEKQAELSMALIAHDNIEGEEATRALIIEQLNAADPGDVWSSDRKLQLINHLANNPPKECAQVLLPYVEDVNDDVVFRSIDVLEQVGDDDLIRQVFVDLTIDEDLSMRIRDRLLSVARERKWHLGAYRKQLEPLLPNGYFFDKRDNLKFNAREQRG